MSTGKVLNLGSIGGRKLRLYENDGGGGESILSGQTFPRRGDLCLMGLRRREIDGVLYRDGESGFLLWNHTIVRKGKGGRVV